MALDVQTGGATRFKVIQTGGIYMPTLDTVSATALHIDGNGIISKASSSIRYKDNVTDIDFDTSRIFDVRPVSFQLTPISMSALERAIKIWAANISFSPASFNFSSINGSRISIRQLKNST